MLGDQRGLRLESMEGSAAVSVPWAASSSHLLPPRLGTPLSPLFPRLAGMGGEGTGSVGRAGAGHWWEDKQTGIRGPEDRSERGDKVSR